MNSHYEVQGNHAAYIPLIQRKNVAPFTDHGTKCCLMFGRQLMQVTHPPRKMRGGMMLMFVCSVRCALLYWFYSPAHLWG